MRSGSALSSGCLPALLRPDSLLSSGSLLRPGSLLSFGSLLRSGSLLGSGILLCLRLQGISALRAEGLVIGYFSSTLRTKHKTPPHKQAPIRHYCRSGPLSSLNQSKFPPLSQQNLQPPQASAPRHQSSSRILHKTLHRVQSIAHSSPQPRLPQLTAATFAALPCAHIRLTSPRSHLPDSVQSPEPVFRSPDTAPQWRSLPPSSE